MNHVDLVSPDRVIKEECKRFCPKFTSQELWERLCDYWMQGFQGKSEKAKKNKNESTTKKHCTRSVGILVHAHRLSKKLQRLVSDAKVYRATHTRKDGLLIDEYSRDLLAKYEVVIQRRKEESQGGGIASIGETPGELGDDTSQSALQREAWIESVGGPYKGRILGFCPQYQSKTSASQASSSSFARHDSVQLQELQ